jgi:hypothetical protein
VSAEALLGILSQPGHFLVLACLGATGRPMSEQEVLAATQPATSPAAAAKSLRILASMGLIRDEDGALTVDHETFARVRDRLVDRDPVLSALRDHPDMKGYVRDGTIERLPDAVASRRRFAEFVADCLPSFVRVSEAELNTHLRAICADHVEMRRLLVDEGILRRDAAGQTYWPAHAEPRTR